MTIRQDQITALTDHLAPVLTRLTSEQADTLLALGDDELLVRLTGTSQEPASVEPPMPSATSETIVLKLGEREYELVPFLETGESSIDGDEMVKRAERLNANSGEDDGRFILQYQAEIPANLRDKIALVFPAWRDPGDPRVVAYSGWHGRRWVQIWDSLDFRWSGLDRLLRRRK